MNTLRRNRVIAVDQTSGAVQRQATKPSTGGSAQRGAEATRATNAGSSRRAGPGATKESGARYTGKELKAAVVDWFRSAKAASDSLGAAANGLEIANNTGDDSSAALYEQMGQIMMERLRELVTAGVELLEQLQAGMGATPQAEATTDETATGEIPHSGAVAGALDAAVTDAGRSAVLDHLATVTVENVATVDAATRMQASEAEWKKSAIKLALENGDELEAHRIRFGLDRPIDDDPVATMTRKYGVV